MINEERDAVNVKQEVREYWERHPNALSRGMGHDPGRREFYDAVASHRYTAEPCILEMAEFDCWTGSRVLEVGCGMGTDLRRFARGGATVVGVDLTRHAVELAREGFALFGFLGVFVVADAEALPFRDEVFDLVYSHGVIHHTPDTQAAVREIHRLVKPGGEARVMVYHRDSYFAKVIVGMLVGPAMRALLWMFPKGKLPRAIDRILPRRLKDMYLILAERGYSSARVLTLSTDPSFPGDGNANPLSQCYSRREARELFSLFRCCETHVRQLSYAGFIPMGLRRWVEQRFGWFLFVRAVK